MPSLLSVKNCSIRFGGLTAINALNLDLGYGELMAVIGPNGAGKTTFFNLLTGLYQPTSGDIFFKEQSIRNFNVAEINRYGIARTFQNIRLFASLSVLENIMVALNGRVQSGLVSSALALKSVLLEAEDLKEQALKFLKLFHLQAHQDEKAVHLSYGDQRKLEIARALATSPQLLLLDEPAAGMNASEKKELVDLIRNIHAEQKISILLIEHDMKVVMNLVPRIMVLDYGVAIAEGSPEEIRKNPQVIEAYLGEGV